MKLRPFTVLKMTQELCNACNEIFMRSVRPPDEELFPHHADRTFFGAAVDSGCLMCCALFREVASSAEHHTGLLDSNWSELKYSFTGEVGDANIGQFEATLYFLEYSDQGGSAQHGQSKSKPKSVSKARFWLTPSNGEAEKYALIRALLADCRR